MKLRTVSVLVAAASVPICLLLPASSVWAGTPFFCTATGSYYEIVVTDERIEWMDAQSEAEKLAFMGRGGRLATLTSAAETACVADELFPPDLDLCIGGLQDPSAPEPDGGWGWITGEDPGLTYTNWCPGEPNDAGGEDFMEIWPFPPTESEGCWNDIRADDPASGYVVEYSPNALLRVVGVGAAYEVTAGEHPRSTDLSMLLLDIPLTSDGFAGGFDVCFDYQVEASSSVNRGRVILRIERTAADGSTRRIGRLNGPVRDSRAYRCKTRNAPLEIGDLLTFRFTFKGIVGAEPFDVTALVYTKGGSPEQPD